MNGNFYEALHRAMSEQGSAVCFEDPTTRNFTFAEVLELTTRFASSLAQLGVEPGERVVAQVDKSVAALALYLATLQRGAVFVPLNTAYTVSELEYFLGDAEPTLLVGTKGNADVLSALSKRMGVRHFRSLDTDASTGYWAEVATLPVLDTIEPCDDEALAAIVYTSGTTGVSKGAMISHRALESNARALHAAWGFERGDVLLHALPIFHIHGLFISLHPTLLNGSKTIFLPSFKADVVRSLLPHATLLMGVPTFYSRLLAEPGFNHDDCRSIRVFISGSAPLTAQASDAWTEATGTRILERYGMTEAGIITSNPLNGERVAGTVGYPLPGVELAVCDADGQALPADAIGTIEVRGPNLFSGYWKKPDKTAEELRGTGFFITGDLGQQAPDGRVTIVGRAKDLIISGGYNIYPKELELVLDDLPGILESAVVGVPHPDLGEGVIAVLVGDGSTRPTETALADALASLARFKHPRRFYWLEALPRNAMGKVQKRLLAQRFEDSYQTSPPS